MQQSIDAVGSIPACLAVLHREQSAGRETSGLVRYYQVVPSASVHEEIDGKTYALTHCRLVRTSDARVTVVEDKAMPPRRLFVDAIENGVAYVYLGCAGEAIAVQANLPYSVVSVLANQEPPTKAPHRGIAQVRGQ